MNITIYPKPLAGEIEIIASKSLSHRYLICAGLAKGKSVIHNLLKSKDLESTQEALKALSVKTDGNVVDGAKIKKVNDFIDCHESGSTLRFMIPIAMLQNEEVTFTGTGRLPKRPLNVYQDLFKEKDIFYKRLTDDELPLVVKGPLKPGLYQLRGDVSSQFITGLMLALPLLEKDSIIEITTPLTSKGYIDLTLDVLNKFGIHILSTPPFYYIKGDQNYQPTEITVEGDFSQAAFFMVAGLISTDEVILKKLNPVSKQGDANIIEIIRQMKGHMTYDYLNKTYNVKPSVTKGITINLEQIPDLGPILMVLAALSKGKTTFTDFNRLKLKESDRLEAMRVNLEKLGVPIEINDQRVVITGIDSFKGDVTLDGFNDHRIVMALSIAAIRARGPITITDSQAIHKSYPDFFKDYQKLGGEVYES